MSFADRIFAPGSNAGYTCPVLDNTHGKGYVGGVKDPQTGETLYVMQVDCPLHGCAVKPQVSGAPDV